MSRISRSGTASGSSEASSAIEAPEHRPLTRRTMVTGLASAAVAGSLSGRLLAEGSRGGRSAVVIGAGIAGLSAAYELRKAGFSVSIFEKWDFVGGRMREAWMGPLWGPPHALGVLEANREMFALGDELGISQQLAGDVGSDEFPVDNGVGVYNTALRFHIDEVQRIPGMSPETQRLVPLLQPDLDRMRREIDPCLMTSGAAEDDESIGDYYDRMLGKPAAKQVIDYWVDVVLNAWGWPAYSTSKMALLPWLSQQQARVVVPRGGIGVLTRKLGEVMPVQTQTTVRYVTPANSDGRHTVHYLSPEFELKSVTPDVVVCATEGKYVPSLIQGLSANESRFFRGIDFTKASSVWYVLDEKRQNPVSNGGAYTPNHPESLKRKVTFWQVSPANAADKNRPATAFMAISRRETLKWQASGKTLPDYSLPLMREFYPELNEDAITDVVVGACDDLIYVPVGYIKQAAAVLREQERSKRGLYFAGEYLAGAHTGAACASGRTVARTIAKHWA